jgi:predicted PurR-regulated permease PerM
MSSTKNLTIFKNLILFTFVILLGLFLYKIQSLVIMFFASFIFASAIDPLVENLSRKIPRKYSLIIVGMSILLLIILFLIPFINLFIKQTFLFLKAVPEYWGKIDTFIHSISAHVQKFGIESALTSIGNPKWITSFKEIRNLPNISQIISFLSTMTQNLLQGSIGITANFLAAIAFIFTAAMVTLYMLIDKEYLCKNVMKLFPEKIREKASEIFGLISKKVGRYVISQLIIIFILIILLTIGLSLLRIEFSLLLASFAAVMELIPVVGPLLAAVMIILVTFAQKPILALWALLVYMAVEWVLDNFIRPFVFGKFLNIHPLMIIFSLFTGVILFGIPGLILAPAAAAVISVLIEELYVKKINST